MENVKCSQCGQMNDKASNRIILDSCGHYKCRPCLINDTLGCSTCKDLPQHESVNESSEKVGEPTSVICSTPHKVGATILIELVPNNKNNDISKKDIMCISNKVVDIRSMAHLKSFSNEGKLAKKTKISKRKVRRKKYETLPSHIKSTGSPGNSKYECSACGSKFKCEKQISYHMYCNSDKPFPCPQCTKKFVKKSQLRHHLNVHAGIKQFVCDTCNASFYEKRKLITHTQIHSGIKSHKCSKCEAAFYSPHSLKEHQAIHLDTKPYSCKTCGVRFSNSSNLKKHEAGHLNLKYFCPTCNKKCRTKYYLQKHIKICTTSFECEECSRSFNTKKDRDRHTLIHSDIKKYHCKVCDSSFRRRDGVQRHVRNTHPEVDLKQINNSFSIVTEVPKTNTQQPMEVEDNTDNLINNPSPKETPPPNDLETMQVNKNQPIKVHDVNDEAYSLDNLYKKIFVYKDHEKYIPGDSWKPSSANVSEIEVIDDCSSDCNEVRESSDHSSCQNIITYGRTDDIYKSGNVNYSAKNSNNYVDIETPLNSCISYTNESVHSDCSNSVMTSVHCVNTDNYDNSENFSVKDIIEANKLRQSVIFNIPNAERTEKGLSKSQTNELCSHTSSDVNNSNDSRMIASIMCANNIGDTGSYDSSTRSVKYVPPPPNFEKTNEEPSAVNIKTSIEYPRQDHMVKPVYLHKKVNYDQKPKRYCVSVDLSKKSNSDLGSQQFTENKPLSKEELSELYKKILFPSYKGSKSIDKSSSSALSTNTVASGNISTHNNSSQCEIPSKNLAEKLNSTTNKQMPPGRDIPASTTEHWRRRLAYSSEVHE